MRPPAAPPFPPLLYARHPSTGSSRKGAAPSTARCHSFFPPSFPFYSFPPPLTFPLTTSIHLHEYLKANTWMENVQQGHRRYARETKKEMFILGLWVSSFKAGHRGIDEIQRGPVTEMEGAGETLRECDPCYSCPAGERIWGIGEAQQGPAIGMLAVCVCVCSVCDGYCDRECLVCKGPCRLPWSSQQNKTDPFVFSIEGIC